MPFSSSPPVSAAAATAHLHAALTSASLAGEVSLPTEVALALLAGQMRSDVLVAKARAVVDADRFGHPVAGAVGELRAVLPAEEAAA